MVKNLVRRQTAKAAVGDTTGLATAEAPLVQGAPDILFHTAATGPRGATMVPGTGPGSWNATMQVNAGSACVFAWVVLAQ